MPRRNRKTRDAYQASPYERNYQGHAQGYPPWIVPPLRYCGPETRQLMDTAWLRAKLLVVKSSDGKRLGLSHFSRGVIRTDENSDLGKRRLLEWVEKPEDERGIVETGDDEE